jgi:hypothetical protein
VRRAHGRSTAAAGIGHLRGRNGRAWKLPLSRKPLLPSCEAEAYMRSSTLFTCTKTLLYSEKRNHSTA